MFGFSLWLQLLTKIYIDSDFGASLCVVCVSCCFFCLGRGELRLGMVLGWRGGTEDCGFGTLAEFRVSGKRI